LQAIRAVQLDGLTDLDRSTEISELEVGELTHSTDRFRSINIEFYSVVFRRCILEYRFTVGLEETER
jgi:hypothetical protein